MSKDTIEGFLVGLSAGVLLAYLLRSPFSVASGPSRNVDAQSERGPELVDGSSLFGSGKAKLPA
jgi:hypothetical protein